MITATWGITSLPFHAKRPVLLSQKKEALDIIQIHAQHGGFSVVIGQSGVGKTLLREHLKALNNERQCTVVSCSRTLHTYRQIAQQLADEFRLDCTDKTMDNALIAAAYAQVKAMKTLYVLIDEAHLMDVNVLRKLRLLFEQFPKNHNLVLFGQPELMHSLSLSANQDIKSRITYSTYIKPLNDDDMQTFIIDQLTHAKMGINTFTEDAMALIIRTVEGNLRLCRNLCLAALTQAARDTQKTVTTTHVNHALIQPHWRSVEQLLTQQSTTEK
jgi:type II secretory pathway predicted ATPase ExeA